MMIFSRHGSGEVAVTMSRLNINNHTKKVKTHIEVHSKVTNNILEFIRTWRGNAFANYSRYNMNTLSTPRRAIDGAGESVHQE